MPYVYNVPSQPHSMIVLTLLQPFSGLAVLTAAYSFIYRLMANHTGANPQEGVLDKETLKSFFGYSGPEDALVHTPGTERIPENCRFCLLSLTSKVVCTNML